MVRLNTFLRAFTHEGAPSRQLAPVQALQRTLMSCLLWSHRARSLSSRCVRAKR